jgi:hypothetical protein
MTASRESYLTVTEYRKRIESDTKNFFRNDPELTKARPVPHPTKPNKIIFSGGAMACVFPLVSGGNKIAVKLFFQKIPELAIRYMEIDATLRKTASPNFIRLEYREGPKQGAIMGSDYTPYVKMEYVQGAVLKDVIVDLALKHDGHGLLNLAVQWQKIALMMEREQIAHGDIQAENLMVEASGRIRLIDLDTMFVPSLRARRLKCVAYGIPGWQHPQKELDEAHFNERLDRFPALAMYLCLLALSDDPSLFSPQAVGENEILLTKDDLRDPHSSNILRRLSGSSNSQIRRVTEALVRAALGPYDDVPPFSNVVDPDGEAKEALQRMKEAIQSGDHRRVREAWMPVLEKYPPAQALRSEFTLARKHLEKLERFCQVASSDDEKALAEIWQSAPSLEQCSCSQTEQITSGASVAARGVQAVKRVEGMESVRRTIEAAEHKKRDTGYYQGPEELAIVSAWNSPQYGLAASKTAKETVLGRVEDAQKRLTAFKELESALGTDDDEKIVKAWQSTAGFGPALRNQKRAEDASARMKVLGDFVAQLRQGANNDAALWSIWSGRPDMGQCKSAGRPVPQLGGLVPSQRASLAGRRVDALVELKKVLEQHDRQPFEERGERELIAAWRQREAIMGPSPAGASYRKRADDAQKRLKAWESFKTGLQEDDDDQIAGGWQTGLLAVFLPAQPHSGRAEESVLRMAVIAGLVQRLKEDSEDEEGLIRVASARSDMHRCLPFLKPNPALNGRSWQERIENAGEIFRIRSAVNQVLLAVPLKYDQLAGVWNDKLCRKHRLFAADLRRIDEVLDLGIRLRELRQGLAIGDCGLISSAWREEFRGLMKPQELDATCEAMRTHFTGPNCLEHLELSLANDFLTVRWNWRGTANFCFLGVQDGSYPEPRAGARPNAFRGEATGGLLTMPFCGSSPHMRIWAMFRFLDEFFLGAKPLEKRLATVEYSVTKPLLRRYCLTLTSLSGELKVPALAVFISENPVWPVTEEAQRIPEMVLSEPRTMELLLPPTLTRGEELYLRLRPADKSNEEWLRLRPRSSGAVVIRL